MVRLHPNGHSSMCGCHVQHFRPKWTVSIPLWADSIFCPGLHTEWSFGLIFRLPWPIAHVFRLFSPQHGPFVPRWTWNHVWLPCTNIFHSMNQGYKPSCLSTNSHDQYHTYISHSHPNFVVSGWSDDLELKHRFNRCCRKAESRGVFQPATREKFYDRTIKSSPNLIKLGRHDHKGLVNTSTKGIDESLHILGGIAGLVTKNGVFGVF